MDSRFQIHFHVFQKRLQKNIENASNDSNAALAFALSPHELRQLKIEPQFGPLRQCDLDLDVDLVKSHAFMKARVCETISIDSLTPSIPKYMKK